MRRVDPSDSDIERVLRGHFRAEASGLRSPRDPWTWLERRLDPDYVPASTARWSGFRLGRIRFTPRAIGALALAGCVAAFFVSVIWVNAGLPGQGPSPEAGFLSIEGEIEAQSEVAGPAGPAGGLPAENTMSVEALAALLNSAVAESQISEEEMSVMMSDQVAAKLAEVAASNPGLTADEVNEMIAGAVAESSDMLSDQLSLMEEGTSVEEMEAMMESAIVAAVDTAVMEAMPEPAADEVMMEPSAEPTAVAAAPDVTSKSESVQPADTTFQDTKRQPSVSTWEDNVSTFSLDTDRTSYHLALNWARSGYEIDPDSVRAEEWINAFEYQYEPPLRNDSFAISTDVVAHPVDGDKHLARIAFQAPALPDDTPVNVTLVLDASGSMADGDRVSIAREAAESIRLSLRPQDRIAVVHFTTTVLEELTVAHGEPDSEGVRWSINRLEPHYSTNVQAGLNVGVQLADRARRERPHAHNYIILMSDGVANVDATDPFAILESVGDDDGQNPLRLITIGVGIENYNDYLLEQLAQHGNGWYRYLSTEAQARATFTRNNWLAFSAPFADQTRAQVAWDANTVETWRLIGYENRVTSDQSFAQPRKEFAEIAAGAATTVFYELELTDRGERPGAKLGEVEVRWVTPMTGDSNRQHATIEDLQYSDDDTLEDALLDLGAIVALTSDLYSALPYAGYPDEQVERELVLLRDELQLLEGPLGDLPAFRDFNFLIERITRNFADSSQYTGYSQ